MLPAYPPTTWRSSDRIQQEPPLVSLVLRLGPLELLSAGRWLPITLVYATSVHDAAILRSSLATALSYHPIFAGRMHWTSPSTSHAVASRFSVRVDSETSGAMFSEGTSPLALHDIVVSPTSSNWAARERIVSHCFRSPTSPNAGHRDVRCLIREATPLLHVSVVHLHGGGTIVCAEFAHAIADGASCFEFLSCWAAAISNYSAHSTTCKRRRQDAPSWFQGPHDWIYPAICNHPLRLAAPSKWLFVSSTPKAYQAVAKGARVVRSSVYRLSSTQLRHLKATASSAWHLHRISTNDAVSALIWRITSSLSTRVNRPSHLRMLLNFRRVLHLPPHVTGNMVYSIVASDSPAAPAATSSTTRLAHLCREAVESSKFHVVADLATIYATPWTRIFWSEPADSTAGVTYVTNLSCYNFCSLPLLPDVPSALADLRCAVDQLESPYGAFPYLFQLYADPTSGMRVVAHLPSNTSDEFAALWQQLVPPHDVTRTVCDFK